ncbi:nucleotidyl transferase AbiEii/AbiGii toxin family protein [Actinomadura opuntiae]|uniref:nucleotidyl transferase AbiEii/AbiGii toxin family protein n=1 Tax=Actinomadura sp. OS1-43 TaxID=604315 RepID=UPI00255A9248|nr:nucleotidyl transferase AbiEii/AbiGii toxin family protein [Actinomadura sp. OS1-43]MDL4819277.1 nucleotidyl transferase AbiEii/AbiGii toxin family protein [Actinomadura sp. OS1-43]
MTPRPPLLGMEPHEPTFEELAHEGALDHVLAAISRSRWRDHLVLRGSALMRAWYGQDARRPHDLDFVVDSRVWKDDENQTDEIFEDLFLAVDAWPCTGLMDGLRFVPSRAERSSIGAYGPRETMIRDREDDRWGFRLALPWHCDGASGQVQVDFAFDERLHVPPRRTAVPRPSGDAPLFVNAVLPEQALCWKLYWLWIDSQPQGKDLYDAWLLRNAKPSPHLLDKTSGTDDMGPALCASWISADKVDWDGFRARYPMVRGSAEDYAAAVMDEVLRPAFGSPETPRPAAE